jgi:hypothetical protein
MPLFINQKVRAAKKIRFHHVCLCASAELPSWKATRQSRRRSLVKRVRRNQADDEKHDEANQEQRGEQRSHVLTFFDLLSSFTADITSDAI